MDVRVLDRLVRQLGGDGPALRRGLLITYLVDGGGRVAELAAAARRHDHERVRAAAHALRDSSAALGVLPLTDLLRQEEDATRSDPASVLPIAELIEAEYMRASVAIRAWCHEPITLQGGVR